MSRLEALQKFVEQSPSDPFPLYGLAMELKNAGQPEEAHQKFVTLETKFPDYVAQYLMHGQLLAGLDRKEEARGVFTRGIEASRKKGNAHALGELEQALDAL